MGDSPLAFLRQSIRDFRTTGSVAPSSTFLARAIAKGLPQNVGDNYHVLEVGPGTGSLTTAVVRRMQGGYLDLWEISPDFCKLLRERIATEKVFQHMRERMKVHQGDVLKLKSFASYDAIVCGLPFNNFEAEEVRSFFEHFRALLKPKGSLIWYEYVALSRIRLPFVNNKRRDRLRDIREVTGSFIRAHQVRQQIIPINLPPARVRQLQFG